MTEITKRRTWHSSRHNFATKRPSNSSAVTDNSITTSPICFHYSWSPCHSEPQYKKSVWDWNNSVFFFKLASHFQMENSLDCLSQQVHCILSFLLEQNVPFTILWERKGQNNEKINWKEEITVKEEKRKKWINKKIIVRMTKSRTASSICSSERKNDKNDKCQPIHPPTHWSIYPHGGHKTEKTAV